MDNSPSTTSSKVGFHTDHLIREFMKHGHEMGIDMAVDEEASVGSCVVMNVKAGKKEVAALMELATGKKKGILDDLPILSERDYKKVAAYAPYMPLFTTPDLVAIKPVEPTPMDYFREHGDFPPDYFK